jgi:DNA-binding transcriptional LysR family regulator
MLTVGIETYLAVVNTGSMSKAAELLHCAQTTVSKRIKALEDEMRLELLERGKGHRTLRLTPAGEEFYRLAEQWNVLLKEARVLKSQGPRLSLVIGAVDSLNSFLFPPIYRALQGHRPSIKLEVQTLHSVEMYGLVENRHLDVAFSLRERNHPNVQVEPFFASPMVVLRAATGRSNAYPEGVLPESLDPAEELFIPWGQTFENWHERWWDPVTPPRTRIDSMNILLALLRKKSQWAVVPEWIAHIAVQGGGYVIQRLKKDPLDYICYKLTHKHPSQYTAKALSVFAQYCGADTTLARLAADPQSQRLTG